MKVAVAAKAGPWILAFAAAAAITASACGGGDDDGGVSPTPSPAVSRAPDPELDRFLGDLESALQAKDIETLSASSQFVGVECGGAVFQPDPACLPGQSVPSIYVALLQSHGFELPQASYAAFWDEYLTNIAANGDDVGPPQTEIYAVGKRQPLGAEQAPDMTVAVTRISGSAPEPRLVPGMENSRQVILLDLTGSDGNWMISQLMIAPISIDIEATLTGLFTAWEAYN